MWFRVWTWQCAPISLVDLRWSSFGSVRGSTFLGGSRVIFATDGQLHCVNLCRIQYNQLRIHRTPPSCDFVVKGYILCTLITGCFTQGGFPQTLLVSTQNVLTHIIKNVSEKLFPKGVYSEWWCLFVNVCLICDWIKNRWEPRAKHLTLKLWRVRKADKPLKKRTLHAPLRQNAGEKRQGKELRVL